MNLIFRGGLGNQMFQLAYGQKLAKKYQQKIKLVNLTKFASEPRKWGLDFFGFLPDVSNEYRYLFLDMLFQVAKKVIGTKNLFKLGICLDGSESFKERAWLRPWYVSGYWQNLQCMDGCDLTIFSGKRISTIQNCQKRGPIIGFHIRRGDFAYPNSMHNVCDASWYVNAYLKMQERFTNPIYKVFTDDPSWVLGLEIFNESQIVHSTNNHPASDLVAMSACDHFVISNSTYSWWAAMICNNPHKVIIAPQFWFKNISTSSLNICPKDWILL